MQKKNAQMKATFFIILSIVLIALGIVQWWLPIHWGWKLLVSGIVTYAFAITSRFAFLYIKEAKNAPPAEFY